MTFPEATANAHGDTAEPGYSHMSWGGAPLECRCLIPQVPVYFGLYCQGSEITSWGSLAQTVDPTRHGQDHSPSSVVTAAFSPGFSPPCHQGCGPVQTMGLSSPVSPSAKWHSFCHRLPRETIRPIDLEAPTVTVIPVGWYHIEGWYHMECRCTLHKGRIASGAGLEQNPAETSFVLLWDLGRVTHPPVYIPVPPREG